MARKRKEKTAEELRQAREGIMKPFREVWGRMQACPVQEAPEGLFGGGDFGDFLERGQSGPR